MPVFINATSYQSAQGYFVPEIAKFPEKITACFLEQKIELPYFKAFEQDLLPLEALYSLIDEHIERTLAQANWDKSELKNIPIFLGSTAYVISDCEYRFNHNQPLPTEHSLAVISTYLRERYQTEVFNFVTSCTSSAQAVRSAFLAIQNKLACKALIIGFEMFNRLTVEHFNAMNLLTYDEHYLPLLKSDGIALGEGIGCIALSNQPQADFQCEIIGMHSLTDNENLTNSSASSVHQLIEGILTKAGITSSQLNSVKVHAVGSPTDELEWDILQKQLPRVPVIIAKRYFGHTLGASGAIETAFLLECLKSGKVPALESVPEHISLAHCGELKNGYYLNYFLGFGGANVGWILKWNR